MFGDIEQHWWTPVSPNRWKKPYLVSMKPLPSICWCVVLKGVPLYAGLCLAPAEGISLWTGFLFALWGQTSLFFLLINKLFMIL